MLRRFLAVALFAASLHAAPAAKILETCKGFDVQLVSKSGDPIEDDMSVTIVFGKKRVPVAIAPGLFTPRHPLLNVTNLCQSLTAIPVATDRVMLLLGRDGRPTFDELDAILIDTKNEKILDVRQKVGTIKNFGDILVVRSTPRFLEVRLIKEQLANSGCDCAEAAIEDWTRIRVNEDKIGTRDRDEVRAKARARRQGQHLGGRWN